MAIRELGSSANATASIDATAAYVVCLFILELPQKRELDQDVFYLLSAVRTRASTLSPITPYDGLKAPLIRTAAGRRIFWMSMNADTTLPYEKTTLDNGLRVVSCEMPHTRSVAISVLVGVGSRYESDCEAGLSHFIEHMVFKGTERRPDPVQISGAVEGHGGVINAGTEQELTVYWCKVAQPHFADSLELLFDMLRNSLYKADDIERERQVIHEELAMIHDYPTARVDSLIDEMLWPDHPMGRDIGGTSESVDGIMRDALLRHMSEFYTPARIVVSVAGSVPHGQVVSEMADLSRDWPVVSPDDPTPVVHIQRESQLRLEYRKTEQLHLSIALPGLAIDHPDIHALDLLSVILGEGMSSRLFVELREKRGLAYDVHSGVSHFTDTGAFVISAGVDPSGSYEAVPAILEQVAAVRDGIPEDELERAKRLVAGRMMLRMEDTRSVSGWAGGQELMMGQVLSVDDVVKRVDAVTTSDLKRVAENHLVTDKLNMAIVGPCRGRKRMTQLMRL